MALGDGERLRPPETVVLRKCPNPVDGKEAFITRRITLEHCEKLQAEGFHACGGCVHAKPETVAHWRAALEHLLGQSPAAAEHCFQSPDDPFKLRLRAAKTWADLEEAYCLVYRTFRAEGLPESGPAKLRITPFSRLPEARTFTVACGDRLVGVLTVLPDSALGLPTDELYHSELRALRESGRRPCEVSSLAVEAEDPALARAAKLHLFRAAYRYALKAFKATDLCALVPEHQETYYRRILMFERLGETRVYALGGIRCPAVGLRLDMERAPKYFQAAYGSRKGTRNLYAFFARAELRELNHFLSTVRKMKSSGQIGGPGQPTLLIPKPRSGPA